MTGPTRRNLPVIPLQAWCVSAFPAAWAHSGQGFPQFTAPGSRDCHHPMQNRESSSERTAFQWVQLTSFLFNPDPGVSADVVVLKLFIPALLYNSLHGKVELSLSLKRREYQLPLASSSHFASVSIMYTAPDTMWTSVWATKLLCLYWSWSSSWRPSLTLGSGYNYMLYNV